MNRILIVDDDAVNRELLCAFLEGGDYQLYEADSGEGALALVEATAPDLVLLDVMMPGVGGFETVRRLKARAKDEFLPVVLVTALSDQSARLEGLRAGADEFLTKPVDRHELLLRVSNLLALRHKELALVKRNVELVELQRFREELSAMIVHDLKNPLSVIMSNIEYVLESSSPGDEAEKQEALQDTKAATRRAVRLLANLLDVARLEAGRLELHRTRMPVSSIVEPLLQQRGHMARSRQIELACTVEKSAQLYADVELIGRVLENVLDNAFRHTPPGGRIEVQAAALPSAVRLAIGNTGEPIPVEARARVFEKYAQTGSGIGRMNLGLGLYFCRLAAEAHAGRIWIEQTSALPTVFSLELPA
jgi:two-component system sensor histidine kinase/response regulator